MKSMMIAALIMSFAFTAQAIEENLYYGSEFYNLLDQIEDGVPVDIRSELNFVLSSYHEELEDDYDRISKNCSGDCYRHKKYSYKNARAFMFGELELRQDEDDRYYVKDVYCEKKFYHAGVGPGQIPNHTKINAEHTWPQSLFDGSRDHKRTTATDSYKKVDLHSLFPTQSQSNSIRANFPFGEAIERQSSCAASFLGPSEGEGGTVFEPPANHKGNVARAMFYFATRYNMDIEDTEEEVLRLWHVLDPVDDAEFERMEEVFYFQHTRNPYIDHPELVDTITNF